MKPDSNIAMQQLIERIRDAFPFDQPETQICAGPCHGCPLKLLQFLESELDTWQRRLDDGERTGFAELSQLIRVSQKISKALAKSDVLRVTAANDQDGAQTTPTLTGSN